MPEEGLDRAVQRLRALLPGDERFGDRLSTSGDSQASVLGRHLAELTEERPGFLREAGLSALQVWDALSRERDSAPGTEELAIVFTDLVEFSRWALEAGDESAVALLRDVGEAIEPPVSENGGRVVKRLGDGMMAVFGSPRRGLAAIFEARERLDRVEASGYRPRLRAGMHLGHPRQLGGDVFGVDVNAAARLTEHARGNEVLVSDAALAELDTGALTVRRRRFFRAKGIPGEMTIYSVKRV